jgi:hypothetical protein
VKRRNVITDVRGIEVGHAQDQEALTGCTVIICRKGAVAGVEVRGGAPGTRETDLLNPVNLVDQVHAVVLAGGSAFGLDAATGVMRYLEEQQIGLNGAASTDCPQPYCMIWTIRGRSADAAMGYRATSASPTRPRRKWCRRVRPSEKCEDEMAMKSASERGAST